MSQAEKQDESWNLSQAATQRHDPLLNCLLFICRFEDRNFSPDALVAGLPLEDDHLTPELFVRAAERADLTAQIVKRPLDEISSLVLPCVLLLKNKQACVLVEYCKQNTLKVMQPDTVEGFQMLKKSDIEAEYTGYAIFIKPGYQLDERSKESHLEEGKHWFYSVMKKTWPLYSEVLMASVFINLFAIGGSLFTMNVYDRVVPNKAFETLWVLAIGVVILHTFDLIIKLLRSYFIDIAGKKSDSILSAKIFEQMMSIKMENRPESVGGFASNLQQFESFRDFFTSTTIVTFIDLPFTLFFVVVMFSLAGPVAFVPLIAMPLMIGVGFLIQKPLNETVKQAARYTTQKQAMTIETLSGIETVKGNCAESALQRKWEHAVGMSSKIGGKSKFLSQLATNLSAYLQQITTVAVVIVGVYQISAGNMTMGALIASTILTGRMMQPLAQIAGLMTRYHQAISSFKSVDNMMTMPTERLAGKTALHRSALEGNIEFKNVTFKYPNQTVAVLNNVSFSIKAGEKVAIIGRIGSGKSTLEKIIMGFFRPTEGSVLMDGLEVGQLDLNMVRRNIGYVPQDIYLFYGSVKDNIIFGSPYVSDDAIINASNLAGVTDFVMKHPQGFEMPVGERGTKISGGQRQAIAAARALLLNPPILLMDEPTNMMDSKTEEAFKKHVMKASKNKTLILVTHKGAMLALVDRVIMIEGGKVAADGPRDAILQALAQGKLGLN